MVSVSGLEDMSVSDHLNHHGKPVRHVIPVKQEPASHLTLTPSQPLDQYSTTPPVDLTSFINVWKHPNGGASVVQMDNDEIQHLTSVEKNQLADLFLKETFIEDDENCPRHVMGIVRNAAEYLPELITYFAQCHPDVVVKMGNLRKDRKSEIQTTNFADYAQQVRESYRGGTFRCGPLLQVSLVKPHSEEAGKYFPDFLGEWVL